MRWGRILDRGIIRRRAGSGLRVFCRRDRRGISLLVWIRGVLLFSSFGVENGWEVSCGKKGFVANDVAEP
jgi:hypothetical protein